MSSSTENSRPTGLYPVSWAGVIPGGLTPVSRVMRQTSWLNTSVNTDSLNLTQYLSEVYQDILFTVQSPEPYSTHGHSMPSDIKWKLITLHFPERSNKIKIYS